MKKRKKLLIVFSCLLSPVVIVALVIWLAFAWYYPRMTIHCPESISYTGDHPGNNCQKESTVWLGCYNDQLYYFGANKNFTLKNKYDSSLCVFQNGSMVEVAQLSHKQNCSTIILGMVDSFIYYLETPNTNAESTDLYCYDLKTNEDVFLFTGKLRPRLDSLYFSKDGSVYFPLFPELKGEFGQFVHVSGQTVLGIKPLNEGYPLGNYVYHLFDSFSSAYGCISQKDLQGNILQAEIPLGSGHHRSLIPYEGGLLVHNRELGSLLYRIDVDGNVTELFQIQCMSTDSAVNVHENNAYLSVKRFEKLNEATAKWGERYEIDFEEGTYRINLGDGTVEKINNMCFDGIFNFDDTCFYCCDSSGNIYRMEFDGTVSPILFQKWGDSRDGGLHRAEDGSLS